MNMPEQNNKEYISRLMAVQACYQMIYNKKPVQEVIEEYLESGLRTDDEPQEGQEVIEYPEELMAVKILPNGGLLKKILLNLHERRTEIEEITNGHLNHLKDIEPLLRSVLLCGVCELLQHTETDSPVIINDYLNVAHEYYPKSQVSFINGILDSVSKTLRENH